MEAYMKKCCLGFMVETQKLDSDSWTDGPQGRWTSCSCIYCRSIGWGLSLDMAIWTLQQEVSVSLCQCGTGPRPLGSTYRYGRAVLTVGQGQPPIGQRAWGSPACRVQGQSSLVSHWSVPGQLGGYLNMCQLAWGCSRKVWERHG